MVSTQALPKYSISYHERKLLRGRQGQQGLGVRLDHRGVPAAVMQEGRKIPGEQQTRSMGECLGLGQRLLAPLHGLHWVA